MFMTLDEERIMVSRRRNFVDENRDVLEAYRDKMSDDYRTVLGFGCVSPQSSFDAVLKEKDYSFLPLCFLQILWELDWDENVDFIQNSLKSLHRVNPEGNFDDPIMAYIYAYCLYQFDKIDENQESFEIITKLAEQCFPPALVTSGDGCIAHKQIKWAIRYYRHARKHGCIIISGRIFYLSLRNATILKKALVLTQWILLAIPYTLIVGLKGIVGEHALYLDFYGMRHHLKNLRNSSQNTQEAV